MARITVRLTPRASRDEIAVREGVVMARVTAPPVDGAANEALVRLLAKRLDVPRGAVSVAGGATSRTKVVEVDGLDEVEILARLAR